MQLTNNNLTVYKNGESDYQTILGNIEMTSGSHYWEIKVHKLYIRFKNMQMKKTSLQELQGKALIYTANLVLPISFGVIYVYGIIILYSSGKSFAPDGVMNDYGFNAKINDVIGVLLEFK